MKKVRLLAIGAVLALAGAACGGDNDAGGPSTTPPATTGTTVGVAGLEFAPETLNISAGTKVTWSWTGGVPHNVVSEDGTFTSGEAKNSDTLEHTFATAGTFKYACDVHKPTMTGTVIVT